jgi:glycosyltransferase involved in cell wall biosynthesis
MVIPAYNEEGQLAHCLDAIALQTVKPFEVIVVDNNSTDATVAIARRYSFVTILSESQQGVVFARDLGFNAARGDIIGRLDGDSIIAPNWVETVQDIFANTTAEAASGQVTYREVGLANVFDYMDRHIRTYLTARMGALNEQFLYGVNTALRRTAWHKVSGQVCHADHLHEDIDLAMHLSRVGAHVVFDGRMQVSISPRQAAAGPRQFFTYVWSNQKVLAEHHMRSRRYIGRVAFFVSCLYVPIHILRKGYNPITRRFSIVYALGNASPPVRASPVSDLI